MYLQCLLYYRYNRRGSGARPEANLFAAGSSAAAAGCEARSAEHPADGNTRRLLPGAERPATTFELTGFHGAQRSENPVQRFVGGVLKVH